MIFQDDCATWNELPVWVNWIYDEKLKLLMIYPDLSSTVFILWKKVLKAVRAMDWIAFFDGHKTELQAHRMIFHAQSIKKLIHQLSPQYVWIIGDFYDDILQKKVILSPHPNQWTQSGVKKNLWLNWLKILKK